MTATSDFMTQGEALSAPARSLDGGRAIIRTMRKVAGAGLVLAAVGLWVAPGASFETDLMLIKLVVSLVAGFVGLAMVQNWAAPETPEVEIDVVRRIVRLVRNAPGQSVIVDECSFGDLSRAEAHGNTVSLWDAHGELLAEVAPLDRSVLRTLVSGLRDAGKL